MRILPNFFVVGTAKTGSTTLANFFEQHQEVCFASNFEPNFFSEDKLYAQGLDTYSRLYSHYRGEKAVGEKSWRYSCSSVYPHTLDRMIRDLGVFKVIYIVRDPLPRALSMWRELRDGGADYVDANPDRALRTSELIIDSSRYWTQYMRFEQALGEQNTKIMIYEDLVADPTLFFSEICAFLGIRPIIANSGLHINPSAQQRSDGFILELLRRLQLDGFLRQISPKAIRNLARHTLKSPIKNVSINRETEEIFLSMIGEDCGKILDHVGRPRQIWRLS